MFVCLIWIVEWAEYLNNQAGKACCCLCFPEKLEVLGVILLDKVLVKMS